MKQTKTSNTIIIGLFVDDMVISHSDEDTNEWKQDKHKLKMKYELSELGDIHHILGMKVTRQRNNDIMLSQDVYIENKLKTFGFDSSTCVSTPEMVIKPTRLIKVNSTDDESIEQVNDKNNKLTELLCEQDVNTYRAMVGSLIYASISTRPDITHAVNMISRHMNAPMNVNMIMAKRILRYLNGTRHHGLLYTHNKNTSDQVELVGYCDADWGGDTSDRKSTTGYCTMINGNLISWSSKKQTTVALSSTEAEYMAITEVAKEIMWLRMILEELHVKIVTPTIIYVDNQSAIKISENDTEHDRTKHIDIRHYFVRDLINSGHIKLQWLPTAEQLADIFTKPLGSATYTSLRDRLMTGVRNGIGVDENRRSHI
jgi:hypothetical protein